MSALRLASEQRAPRDPKTIKDTNAEPKQSKKRTCLAEKLKDKCPNNSYTVINDINHSANAVMYQSLYIVALQIAIHKQDVTKKIMQTRQHCHNLSDFQLESGNRDIGWVI